MKEGDRVLLAWAGANRDPAVFSDPEHIDITRPSNRHVAFGSGVHRCIGSSLARMMFEEMMLQILKRIPEYSINLDHAQRYTSVGTINGWVNMPITFPPGPRVECELEL